MRITESPIETTTLATIHACALEAAERLDLTGDEATPQQLVAAVDEAVYGLQREELSEPADDSAEVPDDDDGPDDELDDLAYTLGSLWGEQLVRQLGWQWGWVTFHDHADSRAVGVFSPDRALAIYPFHFIHGCLRNNAPVTILLAFDILVDGKRVPPLPPGGYENVMDNVHHAVPRV
jgi:hypothetical protein